MTQKPAAAAPTRSFDYLYDTTRGDLYRALATITDDRDLATEAIDVGFTKWRRKVRKPSGVAADAAVLALAFHWARTRGKRGRRSLRGFRLGADAVDQGSDSLSRFRELSVDDRALIALRAVLHWDEGKIAHAIGADGVPAAIRALDRRLKDEGHDSTVMADAVRAHATTFREPLSRLETVKAKGSAQKVAAFAGTAVISLGLLAGATALFGNATPVATDQQAVAASPGAALTAENAIWQRVQPPVSGDGIVSVAHDGTDFFLLAMDNRGRPALLQSENGVDWTSLPSPPGGPNSYFQYFVATPDSLLAVGNGFNENTGRESIAAWISTDKETWSQVDLPADDRIEIGSRVVDLYTWVSAVSVAENGFTIIGNQSANIEPDEFLLDTVDRSLLRNGWGTDATGMQFFDNQGQIVERKTWEELGLEPELGALLGGGRPIQWTSADGISWEVGTADLPPGSRSLGGLASTSGLEAVMAHGEFGGTVWLRTGDVWERPGLDASVTAVTAFDDALIVAGSDRGEAGIWSTTDGTTWTRADVPAIAINQFFSSPNGLVAIGRQDFAAQAGPAEIYVDDLTVFATSNGRFTVADSGGATLVEVFQEDLEPGNTIVIADPESGEVIVEFERMALEQAWEQVWRKGEFEPEGPPDVSVLISGDGKTWTTLKPQEPGFYPNLVAYGNDAVLMVGWVDGSDGIFGFGGSGQVILMVEPGA